MLSLSNSGWVIAVIVGKIYIFGLFNYCLKIKFRIILFTVSIPEFFGLTVVFKNISTSNVDANYVDGPSEGRFFVNESNINGVIL